MLLPKRVVQIGLAALQIEVHASGEVVLQAQQNAVRNGRHDEVEPEYNDRNVMRDLVHREFRVFQVQNAVFERVDSVRLLRHQVGIVRIVVVHVVHH